MPLVSVTRLRLRSMRFLPPFIIHTLRAQAQLVRAQGFRAGSLLPDRGWTFWTMTLWDDMDSMRAYMLNGAHKAAMPRLVNWCDEASVVHWDQEAHVLPPWQDAAVRMRENGRPSKIRHPSPDHAAMGFAPPRSFEGAPLRPKQAST